MILKILAVDRFVKLPNFSKFFLFFIKNDALMGKKLLMQFISEDFFFGFFLKNFVCLLILKYSLLLSFFYKLNFLSCFFNSCFSFFFLFLEQQLLPPLFFFNFFFFFLLKKLLLSFCHKFIFPNFLLDELHSLLFGDFLFVIFL